MPASQATSDDNSTTFLNFRKHIVVVLIDKRKNKRACPSVYPFTFLDYSLF